MRHDPSLASAPTFDCGDEKRQPVRGVVSVSQYQLSVSQANNPTPIDSLTSAGKNMKNVEVGTAR
eukprot:631688-Prorocentrum_minimum.AAC.1